VSAASFAPGPSSTDPSSPSASVASRMHAGPDFSSSIQLVRTMMDGGMPRAPRLSFGVVDVRDVADLHLRAMTNPAAMGQRFLAVAGESISMQQIALLLRARMGEAASRAPTKVMPDWIVRFAGFFNPAFAQAIPELGRVKRLTNEKARRVLGWKPRSNEEAILATAESLVRLGLLGTAGRGSGPRRARIYSKPRVKYFVERRKLPGLLRPSASVYSALGSMTP
jgi:hypothetical protein